MARTASATLSTDTSMQYSWNPIVSLGDDTSVAFTMSGNTLPGNPTVTAATLKVVLAINDCDSKAASHYDAWFGNANSGAVFAYSLKDLNKKDTEHVEEYEVFVNMNVNYPGGDALSSNSLSINFKNNCPSVALISAELDRTYCTSPAPIPSTILLLSSSLLGLIGIKRKHLG